MKTYNFIYTLDNKEYKVNVNANSEKEATDILKLCIPDNAKNIILLFK